MKHLNRESDAFDATVDGNMVVVQFKARAMDILTDLKSGIRFRELLDAVDETEGLEGYVQVKDSNWDSQTDVDNLSRLISDDDEMYIKDGRVLGYHHEVLMARFRNTIGYYLLGLGGIGAPIVAGMQGPVSAEYLGLALLFDARIVTPDTTISFDNVRTGIPSSPGITFLLPRFIGLGKALALTNEGAVLSAEEALDLGLVTAIIADDQNLTEACLDQVRAFAAGDPEVVKSNRRAMLPGNAEMTAALDGYYESISRSLIRRRASLSGRKP